MASTWSKLKIELIGTGEQSGTWGSTTNNNLGSSSTYRGLEQAIVGMATLVTGDFTANSYTMPYTDSNDDQDFRCLFLNITATLSAAGTVIVPAIQKPYIVKNSSVGGYAVTVKVSGQTGVSVPNGALILLYNNGTDVGIAINHLTALTLASPLAPASGGTGVANGSNNTITFTGNYTLGLTLSNNTAVTLPTTGTLATLAGTETLTNKRITPRANITTTTSSPWAWNSDSYDIQGFTGLANALTINADAGTPTDGQKTIFRLKDDGTARALTWTTGSSKAFRAVGITLPTTTVISKVTYVGCIYNSNADRWDAVATGTEA